MKSLLKDKIVDLDLKLPQLSFLMNKRPLKKAYTERRSKVADGVISSDNNTASATRKRYAIARTNSRKEKSFLKYAKRNEESPKKTAKKVVVVSSNLSRYEQLKNHLKLEDRKEKLILFKNAQLEKKQRINLGDLLQYN